MLTNKMPKCVCNVNMCAGRLKMEASKEKLAICSRERAAGDYRTLSELGREGGELSCNPSC